MWSGIGSRGGVFRGVEVCSRILPAQCTRIKQAKCPSPAKYRAPLHGLIYAGMTTPFHQTL
jgi:hypothetical protein